MTLKSKQVHTLFSRPCNVLESPHQFLHIHFGLREHSTQSVLQDLISTAVLCESRCWTLAGNGPCRRGPFTAGPVVGQLLESANHLQQVIGSIAR
ncbi:hypothetical protein GOP47_0005021 [Adiantum capillus-veneris]|uniref:Uncharacterized protein n=1 Tax=Adiantum capillus-veneris TaxID=13818 RepID=A0A9D4V5Z4_ADICA|nr:hypothetical protein GOP47_0005021 [Adiantum capillus-veneris]